MEEEIFEFKYKAPKKKLVVSPEKPKMMGKAVKYGCPFCGEKYIDWSTAKYVCGFGVQSTCSVIG